MPVVARSEFVADKPSRLDKRESWVLSESGDQLTRNSRRVFPPLNHQTNYLTFKRSGSLIKEHAICCMSETLCITDHRVGFVAGKDMASAFELRPRRKGP